MCFCSPPIHSFTASLILKNFLRMVTSAFVLPPLGAEVRSASASPKPHLPPPPSHRHSYPATSLHHPTPVRAYTENGQHPPPLHGTPPSQPTPQVYAALYDRLVARCAVQAQQVAHDHNAKEVKRARTLEFVKAEPGAEVDVVDENEHQPPARRVKLEKAVDGNATGAAGRPSHNLPSHPESNLRGGDDFAPPASDERNLLPRARATSPLPYEPSSAIQRRSSAPSAHGPIARLPSSHRRRSSSDALVNVIKSFEVVLQYRAQGWRILDQTLAMERRRSSAGGC